jgi:hypothetical protein
MRLASSLALATLTVVAAPHAALACGGCFAPSQTVQVVTDHRMVMAVHANESFLWDQIRYTGSPSDFAWVLPVSGDVQVDVAAPEFFDEIDAQTAIHVQGPLISTSCNGGGGFRGFGAASNALPGSDTADAGIDPVMVIHQQTVGPYDSVTLRSTDATALTTWLQQHGYAIPTSIEPVIQFYVDRHMDFVALRLSPGEGVQAMAPVRIHYATANMTLPLRMVSAGVADKVGITLWVVANGRMESMNYGNAVIDQSQLTWDWDTNRSNYDDLFHQTVNSVASGRSWVTETDGNMQSYSIFPATMGPSANDGALATLFTV